MKSFLVLKSYPSLKSLFSPKYAMLILLTVFVPNFYLRLSTSQEYLKYLLSISIITVLLPLHVFGWRRKNKAFRSFSFDLFDLLLAVFTALYGLSAIFSIDRTASFFGAYGGNEGGLIFTIALVIIFYCARSSIQNIRQILFFCCTAVAGVLVSVLITVFEFHTTIRDFINIRPFGPQFHPAYYGIYLMIGFILLLGTALLVKNRYTRLISYFTLLVLLLLIIANGTRSVWIATLVSSAFIFYFNYYINKTVRHKAFLLAALALFSVLLLTWQRPLQRIEEAFSSPKEDPSPYIRLLEWESALKIIADNRFSLGKGPESVQYVYPRYRSPILNNLKGGHFYLVAIRNVYLNYAANIGIVPTLIITSFFITIFIGVIKLFRRRQIMIREKQTTLIITGSWLALIIVNVFYFYTVTSALFLWIFTGILAGKIAQYNLVPSKRINFFFSPALISVSKVVVSCLVFAGFIYLPALFISEINMADAASQTNLQNSIKKIEEALAYTPWDSRKIQLLSLKEQAAAKTYENDQRLFDIYTNQSLRHIKQALSISPHNPELYNDAAFIYFRTYLVTRNRSYLNSGLPYMIKAVQDAPTNTLFNDNAGEYYLAQINLDEAERYFKQVILLEQNYFYAYYHLGEVYRQKGQTEQAKWWYEESVRHGGEPKFIKQKLSEMN